ncbi:uncharacterized protein [Oryza sativa Japonica Group]|uniref:Os05g0513600 protein n=2 Tax=Oryza sativa subsp. japonica TaxID=39947 RepID=Q5TKG8_ORYSJ|nr:uncharacterized protein LOC4339303 [Oryza sativa Japonica Group]AAV59300.1 unknown protein [Oryza sativa Japonica Group]KAF2931614.1 hypothetical protein DAI22_05g225000 [Oryza sativa Japonica Group]BAF17943.1 Os05g0513600 [Oryza sativa Japonica Group]BAG97871.1 unnamed protein product [Oryza sativa Japonica Group]BAS94865.1 Os05g0513600 [Oryza sativa Japonica Group]|eukprot:NP_001056029.1 Os05g0513600 [Oryza sativa Japonica Group]
MLGGGFNLRLVPSFPPEVEAPMAAAAAMAAVAMSGSMEASPAAAVVPCRRDMKRRLQEEIDAVRGLLGKAEALVAVASEDVNGSAAASASAVAKRSPRRVRSPPRRGRSNREELDRARDRRHGGRSDREVFDRGRDRRHGGRSDRDREVFDRARKIPRRRPHEAESEPRKIEAAAGAPPQCQAKDGEIAPAMDASPSLCEREEGEIADDHGAALDIDIDIPRGGAISPLVVNKAQSSPLAKNDDDDELVDISGEASPVAIENFPEATKSSISPSSDEPSLGNYSGDDDDDDGDDGESSKKPDTTCLPTEAAATATTPLVAAAASPPATQTSQLIAIAKEKQRLRRELERRAAREALEAMARAARPIRDDIAATDMMQLGLFETQYIVSTEKSQDSLRRGSGGLLQQLGFFLKPEYS